MSSPESSAAAPERTRRLYWIAAAAAGGLAVGLLVPVSAVLVRPNEKPQAVLNETRIHGRVGEAVTLDASSSNVPGRSDARMRIEWLDTSGHLLLPAGVDPESPRARSLIVQGVAVGEREITLRVTHTSRCHRFARLWIPPAYCEASDEARVVVEFRPTDCKPGPGLAPDKLVLEAARVIGAESRNAECRLALPKLIVTNGHNLEIRDEVPIVAAPGGSRIVAFEGEQPRAGAGAAGTDAPQARDGVLGVDGGNGGPGQNGPAGRDAGPITIVAPLLVGELTIENNGQAGGRGGIGGRGGQGGMGGNTVWATLRPCERLVEAQDGGKGGMSGAGGAGGRGGNGGEVHIEFTRRIVAPNRLIVAANGGAGGAAGLGGYPGRGGRGGFGAAQTECQAPPAGRDGADGRRGESGRPVASGTAAAVMVKDGGEDLSPQAGTAVNLPR